MGWGLFTFHATFDTLDLNVGEKMRNDQLCAQALYHALKNDPFYRTLQAHVADGRDAKDAMLAYYRLSMRDGLAWGRVTSPTDGDYGASVWSLPLDAEASAARTAEKQTALEAALGQAAMQVFNQIEAEMARHEDALDLHDLWYLSILGLHPSRQGKGLGAALLEPVLKDADQAGKACYLTTFSPGNIPFYQRLGFAKVGHFPVAVTDAHFSVLLRAPRSL